MESLGCVQRGCRAPRYLPTWRNIAVCTWLLYSVFIFHSLEEEPSHWRTEAKQTEICRKECLTCLELFTVQKIEIIGQMQIEKLLELILFRIILISMLVSWSKSSRKSRNCLCIPRNQRTVSRSVITARNNHFHSWLIWIPEEGEYQVIMRSGR